MSVTLPSAGGRRVDPARRACPTSARASARRRRTTRRWNAPTRQGSTYLRTAIIRHAPCAVGLMEIENIIRYAPLAVGLMEIENIIRYAPCAVGLKPSAMRGKARLRGLYRIMYSKTIRPRLCAAKPACVGESGLFVRRPSARRRRSPIGYRLSAIPQPHSKLSYRLLAISYRLSAIGYRLSAIGYRLSAIGYRLSCNAISMTHCGGAH